MISPISFGGTYIASSKNNGYSKYSNFRDYAIEKEITNGVDIAYKSEPDEDYQFAVNEYCTIVAPDSLDSEIELFCKYNGINYKKMTNEELLDPFGIENRIEGPKTGMRIAKVNAKKLNKLIKNQTTNLDHCKEDYNKYYRNKVDFMIKSGQSIPVTTLSITPSTGYMDDVLEYIDKFGAENLNKDQLFVDFIQRTDDPDHCVYFALSKLGMKDIPIYIDGGSFKIARALGILE